MWQRVTSRPEEILDWRPMAIETMESMKVDLAAFTQTNLVEDSHARGGRGCAVRATKSKNTHQGGVALLCKKAKDWSVESVRTFGPNATGATLVSGRWRRSIAGTCIPQSEEDGKTLEWMELAAGKLRRNPVTPLGDLSVDLLDTQERRRGN